LRARPSAELSLVAAPAGAVGLDGVGVGGADARLVQVPGAPQGEVAEAVDGVEA
jgi:hypothetical protein